MCSPSRIFRRTRRSRRSARRRSGRSRRAQRRLWCRRSPPTAIRLRSAEYYTDLARTVAPRRIASMSRTFFAHLNTVGYASTDVVEMPGEYALRGGILDVYSPEAERPVRIEFFGDEVESIRKFDPATQRSSSPVDEALLLPLTETPVSEELLGAIHARLSGKRITGDEEIIEAGCALRRRHRISRMGVLCARRRRRSHRLRSAAARRRPARRA